MMSSILSVHAFDPAPLVAFTGDRNPCGAHASSLHTTENSGSPIYASRIRVLSGGSQRLSAPPTRLRYRGKMLQPQAQCSTARNAAPAAAAKGTRGACDACLMPALRGPRGSKWNRTLPGPYPSKRGPVVQFREGYVPVRPAFGECWETGSVQLNHEICRGAVPRAKGG